MSNRRHGTVNTSTSVQIAFASDPTPHHCGYCNTDGSCSAGVYLSTSISLRKVRLSNCGYCPQKKGKVSFGKTTRLFELLSYFF